MEEAEAIKAAQRTAKETLGFPQDETKKKVKQARPRTRSRRLRTVCPGHRSRKGPQRGAWRAGWRAQPCRAVQCDCPGPCALTGTFACMCESHGVSCVS